MVQTPQIIPVTTLARDHKNVIASLGSTSPIFLAQRSRTAAVLLAPSLWDDLTSELARLRRLVEYNRQLAEMEAGNRVEFKISEMAA